MTAWNAGATSVNIVASIGEPVSERRHYRAKPQVMLATMSSAPPIGAITPRASYRPAPGVERVDAIRRKLSSLIGRRAVIAVALLLAGYLAIAIRGLASGHVALAAVDHRELVAAANVVDG
jgi:hypothetical protein